jgi:hypothetical protein
MMTVWLDSSPQKEEGRNKGRREVCVCVVYQTAALSKKRSFHFYSKGNQLEAAAGEGLVPVELGEFVQLSRLRRAGSSLFTMSPISLSFPHSFWLDTLIDFPFQLRV